MAAPRKAPKKKVTRKKSTRKSAARKKTTRRKSSNKVASARARTSAALDRLERELPTTLRDFSRRIRGGLGKLEGEIDRAQAKYRRRGVRLLREGSHRLGALEARGERGWRDLSERARKEILSVLHRIEHAVENAGTKPRKKIASKTKRKRQTSPRSAAPAQHPEETTEKVSNLFQTPPSIESPT